MTADSSWLRSHFRDIPDWPKPGVLFKDITPLLGHVEAFRYSVNALVEQWDDLEFDSVAGVEARGFLFAAPVAYRMGVGLIPLRKPGKLPWETLERTYDLEYGTDRMEVHRDAAGVGDRVLLIDDVLATGGTAAAACALLEDLGATVVGVGVVLELGFLDGRARLDERDVRSLLVEG